MLVAAFFWLLCLFTCAFAVGYGARDGRVFAGMFLGSVLLTVPVTLLGSWHGTQFMLMGVDALFFVGLYWLMQNSRSYWPVWAAASQLMSVLTHFATLLLPSYSDRIYAALGTVWVIPLMIFTIIGIEQDRKRLHDRPYPPGPRTA